MGVAEPQPAEPLPTARSRPDKGRNWSSADIATAATHARWEAVEVSSLSSSREPQLSQPLDEPVCPAAIRALQQLRLHDLSLTGSRKENLVPVALEECGPRTATRSNSISSYAERVKKAEELQAQLWWQRWVPGPIRELWCCCVADGSEVVEDLPRSIPAGPHLPLIDGGRGHRPCHEDTALQTHRSISGSNSSRGSAAVSGPAPQDGFHDAKTTELSRHRIAMPRHAGVVDSKAPASHPGAKTGQNGSRDLDRIEPPKHRERKPEHTEVFQDSRSQELALTSSRSKSSVESSKAVPAAPPPTPRFSVPQRGPVRRR